VWKLGGNGKLSHFVSDRHQSCKNPKRRKCNRKWNPQQEVQKNINN